MRYFAHIIRDPFNWLLFLLVGVMIGMFLYAVVTSITF